MHFALAFTIAQLYNTNMQNTTQHAAQTNTALATLLNAQRVQAAQQHLNKARQHIKRGAYAMALNSAQQAAQHAYNASNALTTNTAAIVLHTQTQAVIEICIRCGA